MFKFLRDKLKNSIKSISKKIDKEGVTGETEVKEELEVKEVEKQEVQEPKEEKIEVHKPAEEKKGFFSKLKDKFSKKGETEDKLKEEGFKEVDTETKEVAEEPPVKEEVVTKEAEIKPTEKPVTVQKEEKKDKITEEIKEEIPVEEIIPKKEVPIKVKEIIQEKKVKEETPVAKHTIPDKKQPEVKESLTEEIKPIVKKGFFSKIKEKVTTKKINEKQFESLFWDLELGLLENNVAVQVIEKIKNDLKDELVEKPLQRSKLEIIIQNVLKKSLLDLFDIDKFDFLEKIKSKKPFVICFVGINGSGKTTTIAKIASLLKDNGLSCVLAAADTFRAASIEQLQEHADKLNVKLIKHDYGSDPAAVAFDAIGHAKAKSIDIVLIDTAGRMHSNENLMDEMKKIIRVAKPDLKIFVGESITGNDCVEQATQFNDAIGIDGIVLSKADIDEKGGAAVSISYVTKKPIIYIGTGQEYSDLKAFDSNVVIENLGFA